MKRIEQEWIDYRGNVLPADASDVQVRECKRAFFAGAWALYSLQHTGLSEGEGVTDADLKMMDELVKEIQEFTIDQFGKAATV